jgi:hypothetical protein
LATVISIAGDGTPRPDPIISALPELTAIASPLELMVTTASLLDVQLKITPLSSPFAESNAFAVNCCCDPFKRLAAGGETVTKLTAGDALNGAPLTVVPGLNGCVLEAS